MPENKNEPEQELGPKISEALRAKAGAARSPRGETLAREARRRIRKRRQTLVAGAAAVVVAVAIGGVWSAVGGPSPVATSSKNSTAGGSAPDSKKTGPQAAHEAQMSCPQQHPISAARSVEAGPAGVGLDPGTRVTGLAACRYRLLAPGEVGNSLVGSESFNASRAQAVATAIAGLPARNPNLPGLACIPEAARGSEAIVLRFGTAAGPREVWVSYDGCMGAGFFTGGHTYGLYSGPLKLFMTGSVRPTGGTYLDYLKGW
jgi:hypothetical protein